MGLPSKGSGALPNVLEGAGAAMIGARGVRTGEPVEAGDAGVAELVDVEDEGVSVDGGEGVGVGVKLTGRLLIYCHCWFVGCQRMFLPLYRPIRVRKSMLETRW